MGIRYYAHLIANQKCIDQIGVITRLDDVKKLIHKMNLDEYKKFTVDDVEIKSYKQSLANALVSENVVKMLFSKHDNC